ncbi:MAG: O-antigen ligase family protein [Oscillospiraceae bacterium]|nr:O-antigen ligase family protein [Oscillospiraceae bacterium]
MTVFQYIGLFVIALAAIKCKIHVSKITIAIVLFQLFYLVADLINGVSITKDLAHVVITCGICLLVEVYAGYDLVRDLINIVVLIFGIYIVLNFMSIIVFPSGMYRDTVTAVGRTENYLLGYKNRHIYYFLPYIGLAPLRDLENKNCISVRTIVVTLLAVISGFLVGSSTTTVAVLVVSILLLFLREKNFPKLFNPVTMLFCSVMVSFILITGVQLEMVNQIVQRLFEKSADFSGRTAIWTAAISLFLRSPIWGMEPHH